MKERPVLLRLATALAVFGYLVAVLVGIYFLTGRLFEVLGHAPPGYVTQALNSVLGIVFFFGSIAALSSWRFRGRRGGRDGLFPAFVEVLDRIAQGDFDVRLDRDLSAHEGLHFGPLVDSVNRVASQLGQMEQLRQEFISNVSHEIQSPLTSLRGFARELRKEDLTPEQRHHYLDIIETESTRLSRISDHMLRLAALDAAQAPFELRPFRLDRQLRELILACEPQWMAKHLDLEADLEEVSLVADADLLSQIWINLLHNSIKFTPEGGAVRVALRRREDRVEVKVSDTGIGITAEDQLRIFERFFKADPSRNRAQEGSGFGLSIARKIAELHQGTIRVESALGEGASFLVALPVGGLEQALPGEPRATE